MEKICSICNNENNGQVFRINPENNKPICDNCYEEIEDIEIWDRVHGNK